MATGYNRVLLIGNLTRDPEYKQLSSGQAVCRLGLAVNRQYKNRQNGENVQEVCFVDIDVWGPQAESCRQYLQKGRQVLVEGRLKQDTWEDQSGQTRSKHAIVAERVMFLSAGQQADALNNATQEPQSDLERELMEQLSQIKTREEQKAKPVMKAAPAAPKKKEAASTGEIDFNDEQPFTEELPF